MATMEIPLISRDASETQSNGEEIWRESTAKKRSDFKSYTLTAWRFTVTSGVLAGTVIFLVNIITLAVIYGQHDSINYSIPFYTGPCRTAKGITIGSHLVINVLSTILLAYSNFSMQCLASPTRKEVDAAHKKHHWLSIGTPSIRNVFFVSRIKAALWLLPGVSLFSIASDLELDSLETKVSYDDLAISVTENFLQEFLSDRRHVLFVKRQFKIFRIRWNLVQQQKTLQSGRSTTLQTPPVVATVMLQIFLSMIGCAIVNQDLKLLGNDVH
ncbi:hypothetical protein N7530_011436 [Penicillium desertorum]|uniref:DUF6536 domain-containing protein n=1 Tax=Penicillium desertorum TaxID=1303715 RepID=A0A9W9WH83_9EURO|nr:hypothetical protein N7530_011436 [Penicillium desertorum]